MTGHIHSSSHVCVKTLSEEDEEEKKRRRRKKDLANASVVEKLQSKKGKKNSTAISAGWSLSYNALPLSAKKQQSCAGHPHAPPWCKHHSPLKGRGSQVRFVLMEKRKGAQNGCH